MSEALAEALKTHEVHESDSFLAATGQPRERAALAAKLGIHEKEVLALANRADLARIKGIGKVYADLLENAGVDSVMELRNRKPENLHQKLSDVAAEHDVKRIPRLKWRIGLPKPRRWNAPSIIDTRKQRTEDRGQKSILCSLSSAF